MSDTPSDPNRGNTGTVGGASTDPRTSGGDERTDPEQGRVDTDEKGRARADPATLRWLSGVVAVIGLWIAASPLVYDTSRVALWNNVAVGGAILLLAGYGFYRLSRAERPDVGSTSLAALLGVWAAAAPFMLSFGSDGLVWSTMASGIAVAILSGYNAYESRRAETARTSRAGA